MDGLESYVVHTVLLLIVLTQLPLLEGADVCPRSTSTTGFRLVTAPSGNKFCYVLKSDLEQFSEKFVNCEGNLFSFEMYQSLSLANPGAIWTEYTSVYPGGPFVDWSYTSSTGTLLWTTFEVNRDSAVSLDDQLCVVAADSVKNFTMVNCDERHHRYCIVEARSDDITDNAYTFEHVNLTLTIESGVMKLTVDYATPRTGAATLDSSIIKCFTDSASYYVSRVDDIEQVDSNVFTLQYLDNGYYWCTLIDSKNFYNATSNKVLYIADLSTVQNLYAVKIKSFDSYTLNDNVIRMLLYDVMIKKLREYVFYSTEYSKSNPGPHDNNTVMNFKNDNPSSEAEDEEIASLINLKRLYLDAKSALLHVQLREDMTPVTPAQWDNVVVEYMRPVHYCDKTKKITQGMKTYVAPECMLYKCEGNFNEGVYQEKEARLDCAVKPPSLVDEVYSELTHLVNRTGPISIDNSFEKVFAKPGDLLAVLITRLTEFLNSTGPIMVKDIETVFTKVDKILNVDGLNITGNFLHLLDEIGARLDLNGSDVPFSRVGHNLALLVADAQPWAKVKVFMLQTGDSPSQPDTVSILQVMDNNLLSADASEVVVSLPDYVSSSKRRVSFVVFRNNHAFQQSDEDYTVNSRILSIKVENLTKFQDGKNIDIYLKPFNHKLKRSQNRTCAFWKFNDDNTGSWSQTGCTFTQASQGDQLNTCSCDHLTHFAEILVPRTVFSKIHEDVLEKLSVIGCCVSIFGLALVGLTAALFRSWRRDFSNKVWLQLCISILILSICFLIKVFAEFKEDDYLCPISGIALHYSVLSSFCWMLVAAVVSYRKLVAVLSPDPTHKLLRAAAFAWGVPFAIVGILLSVAPHSYAGQYEDKSPSGAFCYPSGLALWLTVYAPITLMLITNLTLFVLIIRSVFGTRLSFNQRHSNSKDALHCACVSSLLVFLFGLPWLFGLLSTNLMCAYLFTILITFQGLVLFLLFVCNRKTRDLWLVKLKLKQAKTPFTTTTDAKRSAGVNVPLSSVDGTRRQILKK